MSDSKRARRGALRRGTPPRVCLSSNRVPLPPFPSSLTLPPTFSTLVFPFASLPFTLSACGLRTCARFSPFLPPSLFLSLSLLHIPSVSRSFFFSFLSPRFFSPARRRDPRLVPHRPAERKDCKPADEPRIPEWGLLHSPFPLLSRASSSLGWMEHARREHRQLVGRGWGYVSSSLPSAF